MNLVKNKKLYDEFIVKLIVKKIVKCIFEQKIKKNDVDCYIDENLENLIQEIVNKKNDDRQS